MHFPVSNLHINIYVLRYVGKHFLIAIRATTNWILDAVSWIMRIKFVLIIIIVAFKVVTRSRGVTLSPIVITPLPVAFVLPLFELLPPTVSMMVTMHILLRVKPLGHGWRVGGRVWWVEWKRLWLHKPWRRHHGFINDTLVCISLIGVLHILLLLIILSSILLERSLSTTICRKIIHCSIIIILVRIFEVLVLIFIVIMLIPRFISITIVLLILILLIRTPTTSSL